MLVFFENVLTDPFKWILKKSLYIHRLYTVYPLLPETKKHGLREEIEN